MYNLGKLQPLELPVEKGSTMKALSLKPNMSFPHSPVTNTGDAVADGLASCLWLLYQGQAFSLRTEPLKGPLTASTACEGIG